MAITKQNTYEIGVNNDVSNLADNVTLNRLGTDKTFCEISGGNLLIKVGSLIEANGELWAVDTSDISITLADGYLVFDDATPEFKIVNSETAELDPDRVGFYRPSPNDTEKVTRWGILNSELFLSVERGELVPEDGITRFSGFLDISGKLTFEDAKGPKTSGSIGAGVFVPEGLVYVATSGTGVSIAVSSSSTDINYSPIGGSFFGLMASDGSNIFITASSGTYEFIEVGGS
jgi:hypothetical protein